MFIVECDSANDLVRSGLRSGTEDERKKYVCEEKKDLLMGENPLD